MSEIVKIDGHTHALRLGVRRRRAAGILDRNEVQIVVLDDRIIIYPMDRILNPCGCPADECIHMDISTH